METNADGYKARTLAFAHWLCSALQPLACTILCSPVGYARPSELDDAAAMAAVKAASKEIKAIQKQLMSATPSSSSTSSRAVVDMFRRLPDTSIHSAAYLDAILRVDYKQNKFQLEVLLQFLRGLPNPDHQLNGCWILHEVDCSLPTSDHRQHSLGLAFFTYELKQKLQQSPLKIRVDQFWREWFTPAVHAIVLGHTLKIETCTDKELLYSPVDELKFDHHRRRVFTWQDTSWQPQDTELEPKWRFVPGNAEKSWFYIVNAKYPNEYLYAANERVADEHSIAKDYAFSWCDGLPGPQGEWELQACSRDVYTLFNHARRAYLFAAPDQHHDELRRCVLALALDKATNENLDDRKWRIVAC